MAIRSSWVWKISLAFLIGPIPSIPCGRPILVFRLAARQKSTAGIFIRQEAISPALLNDFNFTTSQYYVIGMGEDPSGYGNLQPDEAARLIDVYIPADLNGISVYGGSYSATNPSTTSMTVAGGTPLTLSANYSPGIGGAVSWTEYNDTTDTTVNMGSFPWANSASLGTIAAGNTLTVTASLSGGGGESYSMTVIGTGPGFNGLSVYSGNNSATDPSTTTLSVVGGLNLHLLANLMGSAGSYTTWSATDDVTSASEGSGTFSGGNSVTMSTTIQSGDVWTVLATMNAPNATQSYSITVSANLLPTPGGNGGNGSGGPSGTGTGGTGAGPNGTTDPVEVFDGSLELNRVDLASDSSSLAWGQTRSWVTQSSQDENGINGNNWDINQLPTLSLLGDSARIIESGTSAVTFVNSGSGYVDPSDLNGTLTETNAGTSSEEYIWTTPGGISTDFYGFYSSISSSLRGQFKSMADADGNSTSTTYSSGKLTEVDQTLAVGGVTSYERFTYSYYGSTDTTTGTTNSGSFLGKIETVAMETSSNGSTYSTVQSVTYKYYTGYAFTSDGNSGDLMTATLYSSNGTAINTEYYRYYTSNTSPGYTDGMKYFLNGSAYSAAITAGVNPLTASDATLATYAYLYLQYNSSHEVTEEVVGSFGSTQGSSTGQGTFTLSYATSSNPLGYNSWANKTVATYPDGSTETYYTDGYGLTMLTDQSDGTGNHWINYYEFNSNGLQILHANPSAVTGYSESDTDLVGFYALVLLLTCRGPRASSTQPTITDRQPHR